MREVLTVATGPVVMLAEGLPAKDTDLAASDIASMVPGAHAWRADHSPKNAANVIRPALGSAYVPVTTAEVT